MWLVKYALQFRNTFYVLAVLILFCGVGASAVMPKGVLPEVNIPVVTVVWTYTGLDTPEMGSRVTTYAETSISNNVSSIREMRSTTLEGITIQRITFQPDVSIDLVPPGIQPPVIIQFTASSVPVIQMVMFVGPGGAAATLRLHAVPPPPDDHESGCDDAATVWRLAAADHGGTRPACLAGARADAAGRHQPDQRAERHRPIGPGEDRRHPIPHPAELRDGLQGGEHVVLNLPAEVGNGGKVKPQEDTGDQNQQQGPETSQAGGKKDG